MESAEISPTWPPSRGVKASAIRIGFFFFFFNSQRFTTNPLIDPLTLLGLFGSFLEPRTPTFTSDRRFPFASSKLAIYAERKLHRFDFFRTLASYPSLDALFLSLSLSRGLTVCHSAGLTQVFNVPYVIQPCIGQRVMEMSANRPQMEWSRCV